MAAGGDVAAARGRSRSLHRAMPDLQHETAELLQRLIRFKTVNPPGAERECQEHLAGVLAPGHRRVPAAAKFRLLWLAHGCSFASGRDRAATTAGRRETREEGLRTGLGFPAGVGAT